MKRVVILLWVLVAVAGNAAAQCLLCGTSNSKMLANPLTGQVTSTLPGYGKGYGRFPLGMDVSGDPNAGQIGMTVRADQSFGTGGSIVYLECSGGGIFGSPGVVEAMPGDVTDAGKGSQVTLANTGFNGAAPFPNSADAILLNDSAYPTDPSSILFQVGGATVARVDSNEFGVTPVSQASIGACDSAHEGRMKPVTNADTNVWGAAIAGTGSNHVLAYCDGTSWTVMAK